MHTEPSEATPAARPPHPRSARRVWERWRGEVFGAAIAMVGSLIVATVALRLWNASAHVPLQLGGDASQMLSGIKNMVDGGWYYTTDLLGSPFGQKLFDYPVPGDVGNLLLIKGLGVFSGDPALVMNAFFVLTFPIVALGGFLALRLLRVRTELAVALAIVYSILPYHFWRGEAHLFLSAYFVVPLAGAVLVRQMQPATMARLHFQREPKRRVVANRSTVLALIVAALIASTGLYYAAFFLLLLGVMSVFSSVLTRSWRPIGSAVVLAVVVAIVIGLTNVPTVLYRMEHGTNPVVAKRTVTEADLYGLKVANLVLPTPGHRIPLVADAADAADGGPVPSEGGQALGVIGAVGFLGLLVVALARLMPSRQRRRDPDDPPTDSADTIGALSALTWTAVVFGVIGGGATIVGMLTAAQLRAWNRIVVYIAFFALAAVGIWIGSKVLTRFRTQHVRRASILIAVGLVFFAALDQTTPAYVPNYEADATQFDSDQAFVDRIAAEFGASAAIFQLPYMTYPENGPINDMGDYAPLLGYLHSDTLRWSYGGVKGRETEWQPALVSQPLDVAVAGMAVAGFNGLYVDRAAYVDRGAELDRALRPLVGKPVVQSEDGRIVVYDLRPLRAQLESDLSPAELRRDRDIVLHFPALRFEAGFFDEQRDDLDTARWVADPATLTLSNPAERPQRVDVSFTLTAPEPTRVTIRGLGTNQTVVATEDGTPVQLRLELPPGESELRLTQPRGTPGSTFYRLLNARVTPTALGSDLMVGEPSTATPQLPVARVPGQP